MCAPFAVNVFDGFFLTAFAKRVFRVLIFRIAMGLLVAMSAPVLAETKLPKYFVHLSKVDPSIVQDMRYAMTHNFIGDRIDGYHAPSCILTLPAAKALKRVQAKLRDKKLSLKVYDCYRPKRAVAHFVRWAKDLKDTRMKAEFYPDLPKTQLFKGYIAKRSGHSRGSTVDLTIVPLPTPKQPAFDKKAPLRSCKAKQPRRWPDNSLDFGTSYDCFDTKSHTASKQVVFQARRNRALLVRLMAEEGFENYRREWWHFTLKNEPYKKTYFDFPVSSP